MRSADALRFAAGALSGARVRSWLMLAAMAVGVAAVVVLTGLGEGARRYVSGEFAALGTNLLVVLPGRTETVGGAPPMTGETARDLTLDDALALRRSPAVTRVAPMVVGEAVVARPGRSRDTAVLGSTAAFREVRRLDLERGHFLPAGDPRSARPVCVIGRTIKHELFGPEPALGQWLRVGDRRFRVIGIIAQQGQQLGLALDELVLIPVSSAQALYNTPSLFRILVEAAPHSSVERAKAEVERIMRQRHEGELDVTVITQDSVMAAFDRIFTALTLTVAGIAAISLVVAGILVMNVMLVAVTQRTREIGLLKALGAPGPRIQLLFLTEAALLALAGGLAGLGVGLAGNRAIAWLVPALDTWPPAWAMAAGLGTALAIGVLFAVIPARRAARLDPVQALAGR
ncbi:MAG TPA: ABC transporter permease [Gammaproteobacteria bacterium]|nr:ABC transporter permease [Gammaproteobacteria bacterium]